MNFMASSTKASYEGMLPYLCCLTRLLILLGVTGICMEDQFNDSTSSPSLLHHADQWVSSKAVSVRLLLILMHPGNRISFFGLVLTLTCVLAPIFASKLLALSSFGIQAQSCPA
jgi:hypothetical protein